jgi:hypothetical protein
MPLSAEQTKDLMYELNMLCVEQSAALDAAVYLQMSADEAAESEKRRARITQLRFVLFGWDHLR